MFSDTLGGLDAIESSEQLYSDLRKDELLKKDVYTVIETITPYLRFLGILSGGITTAKHVYNHKTKTQTHNETHNEKTEQLYYENHCATSPNISTYVNTIYLNKDIHLLHDNCMTITYTI